MRIPRVGVIGTGTMGANHARAFFSLRHLCDFVGVYDARPAVAEEVAKTYGVRAFDSLPELLESVDAVSIAAPTSLHYGMAAECLRRGLDVLLEKPMASTSAEAEALIRLARWHRRILQIGHVERFNPAVRELKKILATEEPIGLQVERLSPYDPRIKDTDVIADLMVHDIDVVRYLLPGKLVSLQASGASCVSPLIDYAVATFLTDRGTVVNLTASRATEGKVRRMTITTRQAFIELDYMDRKISVARRTGYIISSGVAPVYRQENIVERVFVPTVEPLIAEVESFIAAVKGVSPPAVSGEDGREAIRWAEQVRERVLSELEKLNGKIPSVGAG